MAQALIAALTLAFVASLGFVWGWRWLSLRYEKTVTERLKALDPLEGLPKKVQELEFKIVALDNRTRRG